MAKNNRSWKFFLIVILLSVLGWGIFDLARKFLNNVVARFGFTGEYAGSIAIIILIIVILAILGVSYRKALARALR